MRLAAWWLGAITVTTEIGADHRLLLGEYGRDFMPHEVGLWKAVEQENRRAHSTVNGLDPSLGAFNERGLEAFKHVQDGIADG